MLGSEIGRLVEPIGLLVLGLASHDFEEVTAFDDVSLHRLRGAKQVEVPVLCEGRAAIAVQGPD